MNFRNRSRYSDLNEKTYSRQFARSFAYVRFNRRLLDGTIGIKSERIIGLDASFIPKAGKATYGLGFFYNGCNHRPEQGLEISSLAIVAMAWHSAFPLSVVQSPALAEKKSA